MVAVLLYILTLIGSRGQSDPTVWVDQCVLITVGEAQQWSIVSADWKSENYGLLVLYCC